MIIAITQRVLENPSYPDRRDALGHDWIRAFGEHFPEAVLVPVPNNLPDVSAWLAAVRPHGIILSNGNDWGDAPERDATETHLYEHALKTNLPLLGVCRGLQVIHKLTGGEIETSVSDATGQSHTAVRHDIEISTAPFREIAGGGELTVNSYHNQGALLSGGVAPEFEVFATAGDCVEGFAHRSKPVLAIQWHPERDGGSPAFDFTVIRKLFTDGAFWT
ncbi:gamma-glutamyl-gamma-aminobutyrate hydrolase family protein [Falsihalocynthiibacter sp. S25ZX9]|uniref:gamma-glutamyl-gamma-aminobutyrate hydrolase family protein n=1 Tax=Falsihalocynthiibacter sp. S25ZX9 TaxID=3240870 RepID=UPI00350E8FD6